MRYVQILGRLMFATILLLSGCGGGGAPRSPGEGGGGGPGDPPIDLGPAGNGIVLRTAHVTDPAGLVSLDLDERHVRLALSAAQSGKAAHGVHVEAVSDDSEVVVLPLDSAFLPIPECRRTSDASARLHSVFFRQPHVTMLVGESELPRTQTDHLLQTSFELDVAGTSWSDLGSTLGQRLVGWLDTRTTCTGSAYVILLMPMDLADGREVYKAQVFRGEATELGAWIVDQVGRDLGRSGYTFSLYRVADPAAAADPVVVLPELAGGLAPAAGSGVLQGTILDENDEPLPGVSVQIMAHSQLAAVRPIAITDAQGAFRFADCPAGSYTVAADKEGYYPIITTPQDAIDVRDGLTATFIEDTRRTNLLSYMFDRRGCVVRQGESVPAAFQLAYLGASGDPIDWWLDTGVEQFDRFGIAFAPTSGTLRPGDVVPISVSVPPSAEARRYNAIFRILRPGDDRPNDELLDFVVLGGAPVDLHVDSLQTNLSTIARGEQLTFAWTGTKFGGSAGRFLSEIRLSEDETFDSGDVLLERVVERMFHHTTEELDGSGRVVIPDGVAPGNYQLIVKVDAGEQLEEGNEDDNVQAVSITVVDPGAGSGVSIGPFSVTSRSLTDVSRAGIEVEWTPARGAIEYQVARLQAGSAVRALTAAEVVMEWRRASRGTLFQDLEAAPGASWAYEVRARNANSTVEVARSPSARVSTGNETKNLIRNGNFRQGARDWIISGDLWVGTDLSNFNKGRGYAAGGVDRSGDPRDGAAGALSQTVSVPANASDLTLEFYYNIGTQELSQGSRDLMRVCVLQSGTCESVRDLSNRNDTGGRYRRVRERLDVARYAGQDVTLTFAFVSDTSPGSPTVFRIDDVSLFADVSSADSEAVRVRWPMTGTIDSLGSGGEIVMAVDDRVNSTGDVFPIAPGLVLQSAHSAANGWFVRLDHGGAWQSVYLGLDGAPDVREGDLVTSIRDPVGAVRLAGRLEFVVYRDVGGRLNAFDANSDVVAEFPTTLPLGTAQVRAGRSVADWEEVPGRPVVASHNWLSPLPAGAWTVTQGPGGHPTHNDGVGVGLYWALDLVPAPHGNAYALADRIPVYAVSRGTLVADGHEGHPNGYFVRIRDLDSADEETDIVTTYAHLADLSIAMPLNGRTVGAGDLIGYMGNTGQLDGEGYAKHLHFSITYKGTGYSTSTYIREEVRLEGEPLEAYPEGSTLQSTR